AHAETFGSVRKSLPSTGGFPKKGSTFISQTYSSQAAHATDYHRAYYGQPEPYESNGHEVSVEEFYAWYNKELERIHDFIRLKNAQSGGIKLCLLSRHKAAEADFAIGCEKLGLKLTILKSIPKFVGIYGNSKSQNEWVTFLRKKSCDIAVLWGFDLTFHEALRKSGMHYLVLETPYYAPRIPSVSRSYSNKIKPNGYVSLGFNGLQGRAIQWKGMPNTRWLEEFADHTPVKPWKTGGKHVVILGQFRDDRSLIAIKRRFGNSDNGVERYYQWAADEIRKHDRGDRLIYFKAHPLHVPGMTKDSPSKGAKYFVPKHIDKDVSLRSLKEVLKDCYAVVTMNSNSAVIAALMGIPVISTDPGAMSWHVSASHIQEINDLPRPDRHQWLSNLAYAQWRREELGEGTPIAQMLLLKGSVQPGVHWKPLAEEECVHGKDAADHHDKPHCFKAHKHGANKSHTSPHSTAAASSPVHDKHVKGIINFNRRDSQGVFSVQAARNRMLALAKKNG
ncbi:hypothetical protein CYMTET_6855, partial [Cymbomonas tetramitiformis]